MEAIQPAYSTATLLIIAAAAVAVLLFLIIQVKLHAFVSLVLISVATALAAGIPIGKVPDALIYGFADTLGSVALLVGFGVMIGRILEVTGGAQVLADTLISRFGEKRAPFALGVAALIFGFPIFFDAGLVIFLPIIYTVGRRFGGSALYYALPAAGAFAAMHAIIPPHPGPVAAAQALGGDVGLSLLVGLPIAVVSWYVGSYLVSRFIGRRVDIDIGAMMFGEMNGGSDGAASSEAGATGAAGGGVQTRTAPSFAIVVSLLLIPLVLIACNTVLSTLETTGAVAEDNAVADFFILVGNTPVALMITVLACIATLGRRGRSMAGLSSLLDNALGPVCAIILITGAGGMFGGVLELSGIGQALSGSLSNLGISLIVQAFVIAAILRVAQGSATVALTTASGLIADAAAGLGSFHIALLVVAIAAGATVLSHVNDSGFWLVSRVFAMDEKTTLKTWTVMETTLGGAAFVICAILWAVT